MTEDAAQLIQDLQEAGPDVVRLPTGLAAWWIVEFQARFVSDPSHVWWWDALKVPTRRIEYGPNDGLPTIGTVVDGWGPVVMIVTDEDPAPSACFLGLVSDILAAIGNVRTFEFVLTSMGCDRFVFDTHANAFFTGADEP